MATGDPIFLARTKLELLTPGQKSTLSSWILQVWPDAQPSNLDDLRIVKKADGEVIGYINETRTVSAAEFIQLQIDGYAIGLSGWDGYSAIYCHTLMAVIYGQNLTNLVSMLSAVWPSIPVGTMYNLHARRNGNDIHVKLAYQDSVGPTEYMALVAEGLITNLIGVK